MPDFILLRIAKSSILSNFESSYNFNKEKLLDQYPYLKEQGAVFVTLKYKNQLRGCIGSIIPHRTLLDDIIHNAINAGFSDPRFAPLSQEELEDINIEVSVLTTPEPLEYKDYDDLINKITPNLDGLILKYGANQGTFLPQVWKQLSSKEEFLQHLSFKAGLDPSVYRQNPTIYTYRVNAIEEDFNEILSL
jgi:hypothetical protein